VALRGGGGEDSCQNIIRAYVRIAKPPWEAVVLEFRSRNSRTVGVKRQEPGHCLKKETRDVGGVVGERGHVGGRGGGGGERTVSVLDGKSWSGENPPLYGMKKGTWVQESPIIRGREVFINAVIKRKLEEGLGWEKVLENS